MKAFLAGVLLLGSTSAAIAAERVSVPVTLTGPGAADLIMDINSGVVYSNPTLHGCTGHPAPVLDGQVELLELGQRSSEAISSITVRILDQVARTQTYCVRVDSEPLLLAPGTGPTPPITPPTQGTCPPGTVAWLCEYWGLTPSE